MSIKLIDSNGTEIVGLVKMQFVCDGCGNFEGFINGMSSYRSNNLDKKESYCSELCARKACS